MLTGGFKTRQQAVDALAAGIDVIGLARALALDPDLPGKWLTGSQDSPVFPRFTSPLKGGVTAWYTMRLSAIGEDRDTAEPLDLQTAINRYEARDATRTASWNRHFFG